MKRRIWLYLCLSGLLAAVGGLLVACSDDDEGTNSQEAEMCFDIKGESFIDTRATIVTNNAGLQAQDVAITAYFNGSIQLLIGDATLRYVTDQWKFVDGSGNTLHYYWPFVGSVYKPTPSPDVAYSSLDFIGFWPKTGDIYDYIAPTTTPLTHHLSLQVGDAAPKTPFPVTPAGQAGLTEFMFAFLPARTYAHQEAAGGALPLQFQHPFALIKFTITVASGTNVQINSISIDGLKTGGVCTYDGSTMTWSSQTGSADMTISEVLKNGGTTETTPLLVIPNNYGSKYLNVNATWNDWSDVTISDYGTNVDFNWQPGHSYTYNLTLDKYALKVETTSTYTEQW